MTTDQKAVEIARRAAEIIQQRGKATGHFIDDLNRVCTLGAMQVAIDELVLRLSLSDEKSYSYWMAGSRLGDKISAVIRGQGALSIANWSDLPSTTEQDIAKMFLQLADELEVEE
jgi:hypothetical protein